MNEQRIWKLFHVFVFGLLVACIICLVSATLHYINAGDTRAFFAHQLTDVISIQPVYLAYYLIFTITFLMYTFHYEKRDKNPWLKLVMIFFLFVMLMLTGGLTAFVSMLFILAFFILKFIVETKTTQNRLGFVISFTMIFCLLLVSQVMNDSEFGLTDSWERFSLWESAIKANPNLILGVGTGDKAVLNNYYNTHGLAEFAKENYNSHNQFIQILFTNGILGLMAILLLIARPIYFSIKHQDVLGTLVFFPFLIYGVNEVFLGRYQGVVFFALLHQVFISYYFSLEKPREVPSLKEA